MPVRDGGRPERSGGRPESLTGVARRPTGGPLPSPILLSCRYPKVSPRMRRIGFGQLNPADTPWLRSLSLRLARQRFGSQHLAPIDHLNLPTAPRAHCHAAARQTQALVPFVDLVPLSITNHRPVPLHHPLLLPTEDLIQLIAPAPSPLARTGKCCPDPHTGFAPTRSDVPIAPPSQSSLGSFPARITAHASDWWHRRS